MSDEHKKEILSLDESLYERSQFFAYSFFEILEDLSGVELSFEAEMYSQGTGLVHESGTWIYLDIQGTKFVTVGVHFEPAAYDNLCKLMEDTKDLTGTEQIDMFDDIMKEVTNTCSGKLLPSLKGSNAVLSLRPPGVIYGRVRLPQVPYTLLTKTTNVGKIGFVINVDQAKQDLARGYQDLKDLNEAKSAFIATMTHELRTPLNSILGFSKILINRTRNDVALQQLSKSIHKSGDHLLDLVNNILDIGNIDMGDLALYKTKSNLSVLVRETVVQLLILAELKELDLKIDVDHLEDIVVECDTKRINQVLIHTISNALKFTSEGGVCISLDYEVGEKVNKAIIKIKDTGIGISSEDITNIFDRFSQVDNSKNRSYEGVGLGLALSKELMQLHGGCIEVESEVGTGSTFSLIFPVDSKPPQPRV